VVGGWEEERERKRREKRERERKEREEGGERNGKEEGDLNNKHVIELLASDSFNFSFVMEVMESSLHDYLHNKNNANIPWQ
jgi:hypothetical protein